MINIKGTIVGMIIRTVACFLTFQWYDWKLMIIIMLFFISEYFYNEGK